jgi:uncharacterized lipoprotein YddW (UPF0748 family)
MAISGALLALLTTNTVAELPPLPREFRAAWVATVANIDWPSAPGLASEQQKAELLAILDQSKALNLNAIVLQVRPTADALYDSRLEPWSAFLTGQQGKAPAPYWDPLKFAVDEAHKRGLELHCWFNPYRAFHPAQKTPLSDNHLSKTQPHLVKQYGEYQWMDPGEPAVQEHSLRVMLDVVRRYDIDGVHMDDYFYPYKSYAKGADFPDEPSWSRYVAGGGKLSRDDWRRKNVDDFVERLYSGVKRQKRWVKVGISPFGIYRPGQPADVQASFDQYSELYADALKWWERGWCDYFTPQLYWQIDSPRPYASLMRWWSEKNRTGRHFWPGNFTGKINEGWPLQEIVDQVVMTQKFPGATGNVHFSMRALMKGELPDMLRKGPYAQPAFVPASPWLSQRRPAKPRVARNEVARTGTLAPSWSWNLQLGRKPSTVSTYAVNVDLGGSWTSWTPSPDGTVVLGHDGVGDAPLRVAVVAIDRYGNASEPVIVKAPQVRPLGSH